MEPYWFEVAIMATIFALGNVFFGHFEEGVPKWRKVIKFFGVVGLSVVISAWAGREWFYVFLGVGAVFVLVIHGWWLPSHGIHWLTGEPKEKYYELRGWKMKGRD